jgi:hypothetical protein
MIISGWGIFLIFAANQAGTQIVSPYPPFGLATITVLNIAAYLMLLGIYNSASLVSTNDSLRKYIRRHALLKSNLLDLIGHAEMEKEIQQTVTDIIENQDIPEINKEVELDEDELRRYIDIVIREVKKEKEFPTPRLKSIKLATYSTYKYGISIGSINAMEIRLTAASHLHDRTINTISW